MAEVNKPINNDPPAAKDPSPATVNEKAMKLIAKMLAEQITDIRPQLDYASEPGFVYPFV